MCFYEPLHEVLARLNNSTLASLHADAWPSGHSCVSHPYFEEFRTLLRNDANFGVADFHATFSYGGFFASPDEEMPALRSYIDRLLAEAQRHDAQAVFKFCRSLGRIGWMQRQFPAAAHVAVVRNPAPQFLSSFAQLVLHGNPYFLAMPMLLLALNRESPAVKASISRLALRLPELRRHRTLEEQQAVCEEILRTTRPDALYNLFLAFRVVTAAAMPASINLLISSDRLVRSWSYRLECARHLVRLTGVRPSHRSAANMKRRKMTARQ